MKTKTTKSKSQTKNWVLKHKETGVIYPSMYYTSRTEARKAAKVRKLKGMYVPAKAGDGGIDPKKLKKPKKVENSYSMSTFLDWLFSQEADQESYVAPITESKITMTKTPITRSNVNTKPKLRPASSAPGCSTFGVRTK